MTKEYRIENGREVRDCVCGDDREYLGRMRLAAFCAVVMMALAIAFIIFAVRVSFGAEITPLTVARSQIGLGEVGGNNRGPYVRAYLNGREDLPWCAGFVSYCVKEAGYKAPYTLRAKNYLGYGRRVNNPKPGDIIVFTRAGGGHVGIIETVSNGKITTIEGNTGSYPSKVKRITYTGTPKNLVGYVRLAKGGSRG